MMRNEAAEIPICLSCEKPDCNNCMEKGISVPRGLKKLTPEQLEKKRAASRAYYWKKKREAET